MDFPLYKVGVGNEKHEDKAWELGTVNYSINEVYEMFKEKFGSECIYIPDQPVKLQKTLRENDDTLERLDWKPEDRLKEYIDSRYNEYILGIIGLGAVGRAR